MKTLTPILLLTILSLSSFSQDEDKQTSTPANNYLYLSPFNLIAGQFQIGYEKDFNRKHGIIFLPGIIIHNNYNDYSGTNGIDLGFTSELQYRYRMVAVTNPRERAKNEFRFDFYIAPFAAYQYLDYNGETGYYDNNGNWYYEYDPVIIHAASGGVLFGTRFTFFEKFSLDAYFGGGLKYSDKDVYQYYDIFRQGYTGIIGKANLQVAVAF